MFLEEKREAKELATPTTIAAFTCPRLGIGRPELLLRDPIEFAPPPIISLLPPAISVGLYGGGCGE
ncbi:hypothetical protein RHGRI_004523 [Rhododendron griersonianum]|uniref:Uncharacterized protein n=1 Tax=Rhododendron griersonianum TaxID=479676 RepID=A0AAV6LBW9_9ERIC|nr:hypothetical protein RHGRI_004523 [Rhododendron griersonianum]